MKLERRHLNIAILLLLGAIAYNVFMFTRGKATSPLPAGSQAPLLAGLTQAGRSSAQPAVDSASIPPPPPLDLASSPTWSRDPLLGPGESREAQAAASVAPPGSDPLVRSILYSPGRRLAIVDNRIVRVGDMVSGGIIVDIVPDAIVVRSAAGEMRRVGLLRGPPLQELNR
jgi:hypothetical protein